MSNKARFIFKYRFNFKDKEGGSLQVNSLPEWPNEFQKFDDFASAVRTHAESFIGKARDMLEEDKSE